MFGILNCYKPRGITSRQLVNRVVRCTSQRRVGHAGTLDPLADGVVVLALGPASRLIPYIQQKPKIYDACFQLGVTNDTVDLEQPLKPLADAAIPDIEVLRDAAGKLTGNIEQTPPIYSAVKIAGRRAYREARRGAEVEMPVRRVQVDEFRITEYQYPHLACTITCGSGTYIRSLGRDLARRLGTDAVMTALTRTAVGQFKIGAALHLEEETTVSDVRASLLPAVEAVSQMAVVRLDDADLQAVEQGKAIALPPGFEWPQGAEEVAGVDRHGNLRTLLIPRGESVGPRRVFPVPTPEAGTA